MQITKINNKPLTIREYNGQRVLTFMDIDKAHGRTNGTAHRNFKANRNRFIEGVDYFRRNSSEAKQEYGITAPNGLILITESGYLMLAKSFTDDLAWTVQRQLVNCYFRYKEQKANHPEQLTLPDISHENMKAVLRAAGYSYQDKTFNGEPVVTLNDIAYHLGISGDTAKYILKKHGTYGKDYYKIDGAQIMKFKRENKGCPHSWNHLILVTKSGFILLAEYYERDKSVFGCFIEEKPKPALPQSKITLPTKPTVDECIAALNVLRYCKKLDEKSKETAAANGLQMDEHYNANIMACEKSTRQIGMLLSAII